MATSVQVPPPVAPAGATSPRNATGQYTNIESEKRLIIQLFSRIAFEGYNEVSSLSDQRVPPVAISNSPQALREPISNFRPAKYSSLLRFVVVAAHPHPR